MTRRIYPSFTFWRGILGLILIGGLYSTFVRISGGLGASTALSNEFPWGLWIGFDVLCGVALAAGGFTLSAVVYVFNLERFKPVIRPTILTAFLGYLLVIVGLLFDLGQPQRIWHPLVMWNPHSVMFEVAWCVMFYTTVLALEFSPILFERFKLETPLKVVHFLTIPLVIVGVILSMLHQSSLGSLYLIVPEKLHPLWYSPLLPLFFFLSAIGLGCAMTIFESFLSYRAFRKRLEIDLLADLGKVMVVALSVYFVLKLQDLGGRHVLGLAFEPSYEGRMFLAEVLLGIVGPIVLLLFPSVRCSHTGLFVASVMAVLGFIMNRLNVSITGMERSAGKGYMPSGTELMVTVMIVSAGFLLFGMAVKYLPVFPSKEGSERQQHEMPESIPSLIPHSPLEGTGKPLWIGATFFSVALLLGYSALQHRDSATRNLAADPPETDILYALTHFRMTPDVTFAQSEGSPGKVVLRHSTHVGGGEPNCIVCHSGAFRILREKRLSGESPARVDMHDEQRCGSCHNGEKAFSVKEDCTLCHSSE